MARKDTRRASITRRLFTQRSGNRLQTGKAGLVSLYAIYQREGEKFDGHKFPVLEWVNPTDRKDDSDKHSKLALKIAGSYQYYFGSG
ncbi:glycogen debranching enzyme isoform X1 [Arapaima gigas]